ncbi:hypothetical protein OB955_12805 [Halobacteria archaeon AArc-m2/3/4]|uniref:Lipoprotein n=1 Tax=Natronoglomus mannanivorans TaxID=2979990 RepID=A0ABT2QFA5_9EURY|nr:hypothetical protein [Halobacteria archaeon AArc-m2/3/4]
MKRRLVLTRVGSIAGFGVLAGCVDRAGNAGNGDPGSGSNGDGNGETTGPADDDGSTTEPVTDTTIETLETACGRTSEATIDVDLEARRATITGSVRAPNPCHEAVLVGVVAENGTVTVTIGVESDGEDVCMECTGRVDYEATITVGTQPPAVLVVDHEHLEETNEVARLELDVDEE